MLQDTTIDPLVTVTADTDSLDSTQVVPQEITSPYKKRLNGWAIVRIEAGNHQVVTRFRSYSDADGHLKFVRQKFPNDKFAVAFEK